MQAAKKHLNLILQPPFTGLLALLAHHILKYNNPFFIKLTYHLHFTCTLDAALSLLCNF